MLDGNIPIGHDADMSELATYLRENGITQSAFAERVGLTQSAVSRLCAKKVGVSLGVAVKISEATGGLVTPETWITERKGAA